MEYLYYDEDIEIRKYLVDKIGMIIKSKDSEIGQQIVSVKQYEINSVALNIINNIDGKSTLSDIVKRLSLYYNDTIVNVEQKITLFLELLKNDYGIIIKKSHHPQKVCFRYLEYDNHFPSVAAIELTHACNLKCLHCYGNCGIIQDSHMDKGNAIKLLHMLDHNNIRILELTGGDISVYPYLEDILEEALSLNFDFIMLLTNGVFLKDEIKNIIITNKNRVRLQIDLHSLDDDYLEWFTQKKGIKNHILNNIKFFTHEGVFVRIATICTDKNLEELDEIVEWAYQSGALSMVISPVVSYGRALAFKDDVTFKNLERSSLFYSKLEEYGKKYGTFIKGFTLENELKLHTNNCGALYSEVAIDPEGNIKLCIFDDGKTFNSFGNVFQKDIGTIYAENKDLIKEFTEFSPPNSESEECIECDKRFNCIGCMFRTFFAIKAKGNKCTWYPIHLSPLIKQYIGMAD